MSTKLDLAIKEYDPTKKGVWEGNSSKQDAFMQLYIEKLYGDQLHYLKFTEIAIFFLKKTWDYSFIDGPILWDKKNWKFYDLQDLPDEYIIEYRKTNKRFTLYPILLSNTSQSEGHILYMLYDKKINRIEVFDSTSNIKYILAKKRVFFTNFFKKIYGKTVKFSYKNYGCVLSKYELKYCDYDTAWYSYKSDGYCIIWFLWFLELRLKNRNLTTKEIVAKIKNTLDKYKPKICQILIGYAQFVEKLTDNYKVVIIDKKVDRISLKSNIKFIKKKK